MLVGRLILLYSCIAAQHRSFCSIQITVLSSPSIIEAVVGPASFTQVQVAWHHDNPLVTASDPLQRRCRAVSPSLAARLSPTSRNYYHPLRRIHRGIFLSRRPSVETVSLRLCFATDDQGWLARCSMPCRYKMLDAHSHGRSRVSAVRACSQQEPLQY
jgi:hypothetical protein